MGKKYCAFLRGVNVNGTSMKMDDLKAVFLEMGFVDVKTVLATGNVIFDLDDDTSVKQDLKSRIEDGLSGCFHYDAHVFLRDGKEIREMLDSAQAVQVPEGCHHYSLIFDDGELFANLKQLFDSMPHAPNEDFTAHSGGAFWIVPKGSTLDSDFGLKVLGSKQYKSLLTSRNMNTIQKIHQLMAEAAKTK